MIPDYNNPTPSTLTFSSIEVALAELGQKVFGASIVIKAPPAPQTPAPTSSPDIAAHRHQAAEHTPSEEMTAWMDAYRRRGEDIDKLLASGADMDRAVLEAQLERDEVVADAHAQRQD